MGRAESGGHGADPVNCACCSQPATYYQVPNNLTGTLEEVHECDHCRRRRTFTTRGWLWLKQGYYCQDCATPVFRTVRHPRWGHTIPLWPDPSSVWAVYEAPSGETVPIPYCGEDCCPDVGARPHHPIESGAEPITDTLGACLRYVSVKERYASAFTPDFHAFLTFWLHDELRLDRDEYDRLLALHAADMASEEAPAIERDDGPDNHRAHDHTGG